MLRAIARPAAIAARPPLLRAPARSLAFDSRQGYQYFQRGQSEAAQQQRRRNLVVAGTIVATGGVYYVTHLETVPVSGRRRFNNVSIESERQMGEQAFQALMREYRGRFLPPSHPRVGERIAAVSGLPEAKWEFYVIDSPEINAFVIPGGRVFVFTGILPVMANDDGMAAVLGHEVAHQVARHSAERMTIAQVAMVFNIVLSLVFNTDLTSLGRLIFSLGYDLPYSRACESEADYIGLLLMAQACYEPTEAIYLWQRMSVVNQDKALDKYLSTHPTKRDRIESIRKWMPEAMAKREASDCTMNTTPQLRAFLNLF